MDKAQDTIDTIKHIFKVLKTEFKETKDPTKKENFYFISTILRIRYKPEEDMVDLSFGVSLDPMVSGRILMLFIENEVKSKLNVCQSFFVTEDNAILNGQAAVHAYLESLREIFLQQQNYESRIKNDLEHMQCLGNA